MDNSSANPFSQSTQRGLGRHLPWAIFLTSLLSACDLFAIEPERRLGLIRSATQNRITCFQSLHVELTTTFNGIDGSKRVGELVWDYAPEREASREYLIRSGKRQLWRHWAWDGRKSTLLNYDLDKPQVAVSASINSGSPTSNHHATAAMREVLHLNVRWVGQNLADILSSPSFQMIEPVEVDGRKLPTVSSKVNDESGKPVRVICTCDPSLDWYPVRISIFLTTQKSSAHWQAIETTISKVPEAGQLFRYANLSSVHFEEDGHNDVGTSYIDVTSLIVNPPRPDERFAIEIPFGTTVHDSSRSQGRRAREYVAGGAKAERHRQREIADVIEQERQHLIANGQPIDASIPSSNRSITWLWIVTATLAIGLVARRFLWRV